jgi:hypothetical protein
MDGRAIGLQSLRVVLDEGIAVLEGESVGGT